MSLRLFHCLFISFVFVFCELIFAWTLFSGSYPVFGACFGLGGVGLIVYLVRFMRKTGGLII
jgi:hypothetical protein